MPLHDADDDDDGRLDDDADETDGDDGKSNISNSLLFWKMHGDLRAFCARACTTKKQCLLVFSPETPINYSRSKHGCIHLR